MKRTLSICTILILLNTFSSFAQNVGISDGGATFTPAASSVLELKSTTRGMLAPRMTTAEKNAVSSPATGLLVYDTTLNLFYYYNGSAWVPLFTDTIGWKLTGNGSTVAGTNFLGTTDAIDLIFKTTGTERMRIEAAGNVGIGASPTSGMKLTVNGITEAYQNIYVRGALNSASKQIRFHNNNTDTYIDYHGGNVNWRDEGAGTPTFFLEDATGEVGIATNAPDELLHVSSSTAGGGAHIGNAYLGNWDGSSTYAAFTHNTVKATTTSYALLQSATGGTFLNAATGQDISVRINNTAAMTVASDLQVGIGITAPAVKLDVDPNSNSSGIRIRGTAETVEMADIYVRANGAFTIDNTVGTGSVASIDLRPEDDNYGLVLRQGDGAGTTAFGNFYVTDAAVDYMSINVTSVEDADCLVLTSDNTVGIGINAPQGKLHVKESTGTDAAAAAGTIVLDHGNSGGVSSITFKSRVNVGSDYAYISYSDNNPAVAGATESSLLTIYAGNDAAGGVTADNIALMPSGYVGINCTAPKYMLHVVGDIAASGTLRAPTVTAAAITACSDFRFKKDIKPLQNALSNLLKVQGVTYNWRKAEFPDHLFNDKLQIGVIAQDLEKIYPELVLTDTTGYKSVDYAKFTPILLEAIKEQQKIIETQNQKIAVLQNENKVRLTHIEKVEERLKRIEISLSATGQK